MAYEWESSLKAAGALVAAAPSLVSSPNPPEGAGLSWRWCGCQKALYQTKFQLYQVVLNYNCCGVMIELDVGSLPYPR